MNMLCCRAVAMAILWSKVQVVNLKLPNSEKQQQYLQNTKRLLHRDRHQIERDEKRGERNRQRGDIERKGEERERYIYI